NAGTIGLSFNGPTKMRMNHALHDVGRIDFARRCRPDECHEQWRSQTNEAEPIAACNCDDANESWSLPSEEVCAVQLAGIIGRTRAKLRIGSNFVRRIRNWRASRTMQTSHGLSPVSFVKASRL